MAVAPLTANGLAAGTAGYGRFSAPAFKHDQQLTNRLLPDSRHRGQGPAPLRTPVAAQYASAEKLSVAYANDDGDTVELHYESIRSLSVASMGEMSDEERVALVDRLKEEFLALKEALMDSFVESTGGKAGKGEEAGETKPAEIPGLPDMWSAENTSERIVNFATSFHGMTESGGRDFYELAKAAIEEGFRQAREIMGELPGAVGDLVDETYKLTMEKLEAWAVEQGIELEAEKPAVEEAA